jgi:nucleoside-diphosphate-sugar epimerase
MQVGRVEMLEGIPSLEHQPDRPIVVTGGAGYIGSHVVRMLLNEGRTVRVLDCLLYGDNALADMLEHPNLELHVGDFRDASIVRGALADAAAVIHLGAIVGDPACAIDEDLALSTNLTATAVVADTCLELGISRLVFASTCSVYGASHDPITEDSPLNPVSLYANTKISAEKVLLERQSLGLDPVILRFGTAFGLSTRLRFDLVVNLLTAKAVQDGLITIHGGDQWRPFIHAYDIARSILLALDAPSHLVGGQVINVGSDSLNYRLREIGRIIQDLVPTAEVTTNAEITDKRNYYVEFARARELLGFYPTRTVADGVREMMEVVGDRVDDYHEARYHNVIALGQAFSQSPTAAL